MEYGKSIPIDLGLTAEVFCRFKQFFGLSSLVPFLSKKNTFFPCLSMDNQLKLYDNWGKKSLLRQGGEFFGDLRQRAIAC